MTDSAFVSVFIWIDYTQNGIARTVEKLKLHCLANDVHSSPEPETLLVMIKLSSIKTQYTSLNLHLNELLDKSLEAVWACL